MSAAQPGIAPTPQLPRPLAVHARTLPHRLGEPLPQRHALALTPGTAVCARLVGLQPRPVAGRRPDLRTVRLLLARVLAPSLAAPGVPLPPVRPEGRLVQPAAVRQPVQPVGDVHDPLPHPDVGRPGPRLEGLERVPARWRASRNSAL